jgi:hypothetical protein
LGAADGIRQRMGHARFPMYQAGYDATVAAVREALGQHDFDAAWAGGAALSTEEAIAYAQRGRGERRRPTSGWASLTPMEHDVVGLVREGLGNKDIGARLSSRDAPCKPTSPTCTPNWASPRARNSLKRQPATPEQPAQQHACTMLGVHFISRATRQARGTNRSSASMVSVSRIRGA